MGKAGLEAKGALPGRVHGFSGIWSVSLHFSVALLSWDCSLCVPRAFLALVFGYEVVKAPDRAPMASRWYSVAPSFPQQAGTAFVSLARRDTKYSPVSYSSERWQIAGLRPTFQMGTLRSRRWLS